jgi:hypothetical protein
MKFPVHKILHGLFFLEHQSSCRQNLNFSTFACARHEQKSSLKIGKLHPDTRLSIFIINY